MKNFRKYKLIKFEYQNNWKSSEMVVLQGNTLFESTTNLILLNQTVVSFRSGG